MMAARDDSPTSTSSTLSHITVQTEKHADMRIMSSASPSSSTPPTSLDDQASVLSDTAKQGLSGDRVETISSSRAPDMESPGTPQPTQETAASEGRRSARSSRKSVTTYNVQILAGTAIHTPTKYLEKHHKNVLHGSLEDIAQRELQASTQRKMHKRKSTSALPDDPVEEQLSAEVAQAARRRTSARVTDLRKEALRNVSGSVGELVANAFLGGKRMLQGTLRKSASAPNLKADKPNSSMKRSRNAMEDEEGSSHASTQDAQVFLKPKTKAWLPQGLYVGQFRDFDPRLSEKQNRAKKRAKKTRDDAVLPLPMFAAERLLNEDPKHVFRDFKLPFDTYNPLPRKVKVDGWVKLHKSEQSIRYETHI